MSQLSVRPRLPTGVWVSASAVTALLLAVSARYGFHRDELYFVVAGRNLDWGYVDQPPLTPLVARLADAVATSPVALRVLPAVAVGAIGVITAIMARRFGASARGQVFAAFTAGWVGFLLGAGHLLSTAVFDYLFWSLALLIVAALLDGASPRWWVGLGVVIGIGLENKHTIGFLAVAILLGLLATRQRRLLASVWPWVGVLVAGALAAPNLVWQAVHDWPQLEMSQALSGRSDGPVTFIVEQALLFVVFLLIPAAAGWWWLARNPTASRWRPFALMYVILFVFFLVVGGKSYYLAPMYTPLLAAGGVWLGSLSAMPKRAMWGAAGLSAVIGVLLALPVVPVDAVPTFDASGELGETVGWEELVDQIGVVADEIPAEVRSTAVVFTSSYGEAAAVDVLGPDHGLPSAASGHNNYWLWGPPPNHGPIIIVGPVADALNSICPHMDRVGVVTNPYGVENEVNGKPLLLCMEPTGQLADIWDELRHLS